MPSAHVRRVVASACLGLSLLLGGCAPKAGGGKLATRLSPAPPTVTLDPPPPERLLFLRAKSAKVPVRSQGGQLWDEVGAFPDPYIVVKKNGKVLFESPAAENTLKPQWTAPGGNYVIKTDDKLEILLKDADAIHDLQMGRAVMEAPGQADIDLGYIEVDTGNRGRVTLEVMPAHALIGLGFDYAHYDGRVQVLEVWKHSPAGRGGMVKGDMIVRIGAKKVNGMKAREIRSAINAIGKAPVNVVVQHKDGKTETVQLGVGPIYPLVDEYGLLD